jgi:tetratricopeptide (TPR) repeat protein
LNADYLIHGSVRRAAEKIRISAQVEDTAREATIWAATYERELTAENIFALQDEIMSRIVSAVGEPWGIVPNAAVSGTRGKATATLEGYECLLRTYAFYREFSEIKHAQVRDCLERTVNATPEYADAWAYLSFIYNEEHALNFNPRPNPLDRSLKAAQRAITLDPSNFAAYGALADTYFFRREIDEFLVAGEKAISLNPNDSARVALIGGYMAFSGKWEEGMALVNKATQLNPNLPGWVYTFPAFNFYRLGNYSEAVVEAQRINIPDLVYMHLLLAASYGQLEQGAKARTALNNVVDIEPNYLTNPRGELNKYFAEPAFVTHVLDGLRKAGLPE